MPKSEFTREIESYVGNLKKVSKILDLSHISAEGMEETPEAGIPFNKALSYVEGARELVDQAIKNFNATLRLSEKKPGKPRK